VEALSKQVTARLAEAKAIERKGNGFRVRAGGDWMDVDRLVLALPAHAAAALLSSVDGKLSTLLSGIPYSSSLTLSLIYRESEFDGQRAGFGFLVPKTERQRLAACTFVGTKFPYRAPDDRIVLRCFFGGVADEAVLSESNDALIEIARQELRRILGLTAAPIFHAISRWPRSMAQYTVGHGSRVQEIKDRAAAIPGLYLAGNAYEGIGIPDCVRTGRTAAKQILAAATS
jgi:protoporphyrinogen/coproporphyrinogen III oxidase